jgi:KaiC/GvpD/RAD55 family RecA-like ATPase
VPELLSTGVAFLDVMLDGGLEPGTLTVVHGATGVGKTQLGLAFVNAGLSGEGRRGVLMDLTTRGDSQQHADYARRLCGWELATGEVALEDVWSDDSLPERFVGLDYSGKPVTRANLEADEWRRHQARLNQRLEAATAFLYAHFTRRVRRVVIDGIEPAARVEDSVQLQLIEYLYQHILRTEHDWVARELFRGQWTHVREQVLAHAYDRDALATVVLQTSPEIMLDDLLVRDVLDGDLTTNANTVILLGRRTAGSEVGRAAFVLKHRGRRCSEAIVPFRITDRGIELQD